MDGAPTERKEIVVIFQEMEMTRKTLIAAALCASCVFWQESFAASESAAQASDIDNDDIDTLEQKCSNANAGVLMSGNGVKADDERAARNSSRGCELKSLDASLVCIGYCKQANQPAEAADAYVYVCDLNDASSCNGLGKLLYIGD